MKKKILSFLIAICLIVPCAFTLVGCKDKETKIEVWNGKVANVSAAVNNIITIDTAEELAGFAKSVNSGTSYVGKTIKLACDMDMRNKTWTPIGVGNRKDITSAKPFSGTFDGNGKKIINISNEGYLPLESYKENEGDINGKTYSYGFFGMTQNAVIKNLTVEVDFDCDDDNLKGDSVGGLVGFANKGLIIENCKVYGEINGGYDAVGGLVGRAYNSSPENSVEIKNCVNNAEIEAMFKAAGILGYASSGTMYLKIENCVNKGEIEVEGVLRNDSYISCIAGILNYGWVSNAPNTLIVTNNKNTGILKSVEELCETVGIKNSHAYALIAGSVSYPYTGGTHVFNFTGNVNTGKVYYLDEQANDALGATINQLYPEYIAAHDFNNKTNINQ